MLRFLKRHFSVKLKISHFPENSLTIKELRMHLYGNLFIFKQKEPQLVTVIEDLHTTKSQDAFMNDMEWLGLKPKEVVKQSQCLDQYKKIEKQLTQAGRVYLCFCSDERIKELKQKGEIYDRKCQSTSVNQALNLVSQGKSYKMRFLNDNQSLKLQDAVFGDLKETKTQPEDFVIREEGKGPSAYFAQIADQIHLNTTHFMNDINNVKQTWDLMSVCQALNIKSPEMIHLPKIIGNQLPKWTEIQELRKKDIIPQAIVNTVALLGWQPFGSGVLSKFDETSKKFTMDHLLAYFDIDKISKNDTVWQKKALLYFNKKFMKDALKDMKTFKEKLEQALPNVKFDNVQLIEANNIVKESKIEEWHQLKQFSYLFLRPDLSSQQFKKQYKGVFGDRKRNGEPTEIAEEDSDSLKTLRNLLLICHHIIKDNNFKGQELAKCISQFLMDSRIDNEKVYGMLRLALTGQTNSAYNVNILKVCEMLGRVEVVERLKLLF